MTIEINEPEIEEIIRRRVESGSYRDAADVVAQALRGYPATQEFGPDWPRTGADLVAALQSSPHKDADIEPSRPHLPVREFSW